MPAVQVHTIGNKTCVRHSEKVVLTVDYVNGTGQTRVLLKPPSVQPGVYAISRLRLAVGEILSRTTAVKQKLKDLFPPWSCCGSCSWSCTPTAICISKDTDTAHTVHMLRANHRAVGMGWFWVRAGFLNYLLLCPSVCHRRLLKTLPTGSLQTKNGSTKIYYKNAHSSGRQAAAYYVKSAQHTHSLEKFYVRTDTHNGNT